MEYLRMILMIMTLIVYFKLNDDLVTTCDLEYVYAYLECICIICMITLIVVLVSPCLLCCFFSMEKENGRIFALAISAISSISLGISAINAAVGDSDIPAFVIKNCNMTSQEEPWTIKGSQIIAGINFYGSIIGFIVTLLEIASALAAVAFLVKESNVENHLRLDFESKV